MRRLCECYNAHITLVLYFNLKSDLHYSKYYNNKLVIQILFTYILYIYNVLQIMNIIIYRCRCVDSVDTPIFLTNLVTNRYGNGLKMTII